MPAKKQKSRLEQIHAKIKRAHAKLEKLPAWKSADKLRKEIEKLEIEESKVLGVPLLPGRGGKPPLRRVGYYK
jgi:hypothetical protein